MAKRGRRKGPKDHTEGHKTLVRNRKARHDYAIEETVEAGVVLVGSEVKSLRESKAALKDAFVQFRRGEAWLVNAQIDEYPWANQFNHEPKRERKLLLNAHEIKKLATRVEQRGYSLVPLAFYLKNGKIKVELGLGTGKAAYEKRDSKREAEARREIDRAMKQR